MIRPLPPLSPSAVRLGVRVRDWEAAVRLAGAALADAHAVSPVYADEMVRMVRDHGPYIVIAPGIALAHARPGPEVYADALSLVTLAAPVTFGHPDHDPVRLVVGLSSTSADEHIAAVADVANRFNSPDLAARLLAATTIDEAVAAFSAP